jgi:hypothetical protein
MKQKNVKKRCIVSIGLRPKVTKSILAKAFNSSLDDIIP